MDPSPERPSIRAARRSGTGLFALVQAYAALGDHRTGTDVDHHTAHWLGGLLTAAGLEVAAETVPFDRWVATSRLTADGEPVEHLPLFHSWSGTISTDSIAVEPLDPRFGGFPDVADATVGRAALDGAEAAVVVTEHPQGSLVAINRAREPRPLELPTLLVAGRELDRLRTADSLRLDLEAHLEPGATTNLVATTAHPGDPMVLTTPLTGWFKCAGERGTGIAVLVDLVERFADRPLVVVATGGHELGCFGAHHQVAGWSSPVVGVVHIGASVAVDEPTADGTRRLVDTRTARTSLASDAASSMAGPMQRAGLDLDHEADAWIGEADAWSRIGRPLVSISGAGVDFHTPGDTPERVTSPASLDLVAGALADAVEAFWNAADPRTDATEAGA